MRGGFNFGVLVPSSSTVSESFLLDPEDPDPLLILEAAVAALDPPRETPREPLLLGGPKGLFVFGGSAIPSSDGLAARGGKLDLIGARRLVGEGCGKRPTRPDPLVIGVGNLQKAIVFG